MIGMNFVQNVIKILIANNPHSYALEIDRSFVYCVNMTTQSFIELLQSEVDPTLNLRQNNGNLDIKSIYWGNIYTETAIPANEIKEERDPLYTDNFGVVHRGTKEARARVEQFIQRFNTDQEFKKDVLGDDQ